MLNERWVYRYHYAWNKTLFYDPLEVYYRPLPDHFLSSLDEEVRSRFVRSGIWWSYRYNPRLPTQGWKIHVSATHRNVREVAAAVIEHLTTRGIDFKIALDLNIFERLNGKPMSRGSSGKLITVYPNDDDEFRECVADLAQVLSGAEGAYVLSDLRYKECGALYFRYGQLLDTHSVDAMGRKQPHIIGPDGPVPDVRRPAYSQPSWVPWPFDDWKPDNDPGDGDLLGGRFRVTEAIQFSNTGGVYRAEDTANGNRLVVLKEARPHTGCNPRQDHDAVDISAREWAFLNRLAGTGSFPAPIATFRHWEHQFIAEELIEGSDIRAIFLEHNPLIWPDFDVARSKRYLRTFITVFRGLARAVQAAHGRQVIIGDLSPANLIVHPDTLEVTLVDLESCRLATSDAGDAHLQGPVELFQAGFSRSQTSAATPEDDLYGLAMTMAYFIFPVAAMSDLREDVLDLYRIYTDALGWPLRIHQTLTDLAQARISLTDLLRFLDNEAELVGQVDVPPDEPIVEEGLRLTDVEAGVGAFAVAVADVGRDSLFPVDPFAHTTNPLSLGFGASGVLWALAASGLPIQPEWLRWLRDRLETIDVEEYPAGLMSGLAGIAWAADDLGLRPQARQLLAQANQRVARTEDYTFYYGLAGLGMTNLHFYLRGHAEPHLAAARECAQALRATAQTDGWHVHWRNDFATDGPLTGLGFGQAGVAMFLLRMYQITEDESCLRLGERALAWELANAEPQDDGSVTFRHEGTGMPYVEVGAAGVAQVLLRYGDLDAARTVLRGVRVGFTSLAGYGFGMCGIADAMLDAAAILGDLSYRDTALRQLDYVRKVFLFEPPERFAIPHRDGVAPLGVPGEGLLRCSCDLMTGSAGVLRVFHRVNAGGTADFLLDEVRV